MIKFRRNILWALISVLPITIFNLYLANKYLPLSEGWWVTYAYLMQFGLEIFKDFKLPTAPLFVYLHHLIYGAIEFNYVYVKYIGITVNSGLFLFIYLILCIYYNNKISFLATVLSTFVYITSPVYAPHDYHVLVDLFVAISIYFLLISGKSTNKKFQFINSFFAGIIVAALFFTKQNVGIFIILGQFIALIFYKKIKEVIIGYTIGILGFSILFTYLINYSLLNIFEELVFRSDSKGSIVTVLFRFLIEWDIIKILSIALLLAILNNFLLTNLKLISSNNLSKNISKKLNIIFNYLKEKKVFLFIVSLIIFLLISRSFNTNILLICGISYIFYNLIFNIKRDEGNYALVFLSMLFLLYTNTQTGGIANWGTIIATALFFAFIFNEISNAYSAIPIYSAVIISIITIVNNKMASPYEFWGSVQTNVLNKQFELPYSQLKNIYVGEDTYKLFSKIKNAIEKNSTSSKDVYLYPNIPIFYYLHNKLPPTNVLGQWFDFINKDQVEAELNYLKTTPPRLLILFDPPMAVYDGHQEMIKHDLGQREIIALLNNYVNNGRYKVFDQMLYCGNLVKLNDFKRKQNYLRVQFIIRNSLPDDYSLKSLLNDFPAIEVVSYLRGNEIIQSSEIILDKKLMIGDKITLNIDGSNLNTVLSLFGDYNKYARNLGIDSCYNLKILKINE